MRPRHELPVHSPVSAADILVAAGGRAVAAADVVDRVRELLKEGYSASDVLLVDSGRSALQLALDTALSGSRERIVALPAFQCYEVASAAVGAGCRIALYDVDPATLQPRFDSLERALSRGARCVVIAPLYGLPVDWDAVVALAGRHGAVLIEDAAQAHGAEWRGRPVGSFGDMSVVSFGRGKGWTGGRGGALLLRSPDAVRHLHSLDLARTAPGKEMRVAATTVLQVLFGRPWLYGIPAAIPSLGLGETRYHEPAPPARLPPFAAALLLETRQASADEVPVRRRTAAWWAASLPAELLADAPAVHPGGVAGYLRFPLCVPAAALDAAAGAAARHAGIARSYPLTLGELPAVAPRLVEPAAAYPGAMRLSRQVVTLPTHSRLGTVAREGILRLAGAWVRTLPRTTRDTVA